ncbi:MAG: leucyl/phenylalanyl-tRNA--protein transferase [Synechococcaceae cyanobacterium]|nr:leucyl/phenylalanyl-tRNA--protein transferase [Synechococcaceae cyanobacterium]
MTASETASSREDSLIKLIGAYAEGWFPMAEPLGDQRYGALQLYRSLERALLPLDSSLHASRSLGRVLRARPFRLSLNRAFHAVVQACADRPETWISPQLTAVYGRLHAAGIAHSVEAWQGNVLAAGLLGIAIGRCWIGESMAHRLPNAGKVLLVELTAALEWGGFSLFDVQLSTPHLKRFGCFSISDAEYTDQLHRARCRPGRLRLGDDSLESHTWPPPDAKIGADKKQT